MISCGSGVLLADGLVLTNSHLIHSICKFGDCANLEIHASSNAWAASSAELVVDIPSIDVALLIPKPPLGKGIFALSETAVPQLGFQVATLSFPGCGDLTSTAGKVEKVNEIKLYTSCLGQHGSSGGVIFDKNYKLVGLIDEAGDLLSAASSLLVGTNFKLRGSRADVISKVLAKPEAEQTLVEAALLYAYYKSEVMNSSGWTRVWAGLDFMAIFEDFRKRAELLGHAGFSGVDQYISSLALIKTMPNSTELQNLIVLLSAAYSTENKGPFYKLLVPLDLGLFAKQLRAHGKNETQIDSLREIVRGAAAQGYPGVQLFLLGKSVLYFLIALLVSGIWAFSLGTIYARLTGSFFKRIFIISLVGLLWPFSLLWWKFRGRLRHHQ